LDLHAVAGSTDNGGYYGLWMGGLYENISAPNVPAEVLADAAKNHLPQNLFSETSLRLQYSWGVNMGFFAGKYTKISADFNRSSWRYDYLGYGAGTTIPYYKDIEKALTLKVNISTPFQHNVRVFAEVGGGWVMANYWSGVESYLTDGDNTQVASRNGFIIPVSAGLSYAIKIDDSLKVYPYVRAGYDHSFLASGISASRYCVSFGLGIGNR